ncbi:MAG TPA: hypothetical protein VFC00_20530 [Micromonosporaceae bacterium]|nr:hypothetical protein [Micromonosporaceae bacterium]
MRRAMCAAIAVLVGASVAVVATPAWAVPGLVAVTVTSAEVGSESFKGANAVCPAGTKIVGGGADVLGGGHSVRIAGINPAPLLPNPNSLWATAHEDVLGYSGVWSLRAWAICASGVTGWQVVLADNTGPTNGYAFATASCPAGKKVIGAGGRSTGKPSVVLDSINIAADLSSVTVEVVAINGATPIAYAYAICINPVPRQQRVALNKQPGSDDQTLALSCPEGTKTHGVGGGMTAAVGQSYLDELAPNGASLTGVYIDAREDATGNPFSWSVNLQAVCAG